MDYAVFTAIIVTIFIIMTVLVNRIARRKEISEKELMGKTTWMIRGSIAAILLFGLQYVQSGEVEEHTKLKGPLVGMAPIFARVLQEEGHGRIQLDTLPEDSHYQKLLVQMKGWLTLYPNMQSVYTMRKQADGTNVFILDPAVDYDGDGTIGLESEKTTPVGVAYTNFIPELENAFLGKVTFQEEAYTDKWGTFISAFAPIYDKQGKVEAVVGVDFDYKLWKEKITHARLIRIFFLNVPLLLLMGFYWMMFQHRLESYQVEKNEQRYRQLMERYRSLLDVSPDAILVHDGTILFINDKGLKMLGATEQEQIAGKDLLEFTHPDDRELVISRVKTMMETGEPLPNQEIRLYGLNQEIYYIEFASIPIQYKGKRAIQVIARDVTDKKRMEHALEKSEERFRKIFEKAGIGIGLRRKSGEIIEINPALERMTGYTKEQLKHIPISAISQPVQPEEQLYRELISGKRDVYSIEKLYYRPDGQIVRGMLTVSLFPSTDQTDNYIIGMVVDITEKNRMEKQITESEQRYRSLVEYSPNAIVVHDGKQIIYANPASVSLFGAASSEELLGRPVMELVHPEYQELAKKRIYYMQSENKHVELTEERFLRMDGTAIDVEVIANSIEYMDQPVYQTIIHDISKRKEAERELKEAEEELRKSEELFRLLTEYSSDMITLHDAEGKYIYVSPACKEMLQYEDEELIGQDSYLFIHPDDCEHIRNNHQILLERGYVVSTYRIRRKDGEYVWLESSIKVFNGVESGNFELVVVSRNVHQRKLAEQKLQEANELLQRLSAIDGLTGIANRRSFDERINGEWNRSIRHSTSISLIMLDIDFFKAYNDTYGHQVGDECLKQVASTIQGMLGRSSDLVCRYGGEEFAVIMPDTNESGAQLVAQNIRNAIEMLEIPHIGSKVSEWVTLSLGTATMIPFKNSSSAELILAADKALYQAKQEGRNCVRTYNVQKVESM